NQYLRMDVMKTAKMHGEEAEEEADSKQENENECDERAPIAAEHRALAPRQLGKLGRRLDDHPYDGGIADDEARKPERPDQVACAPVSVPGNGEANRDRNSVGPAGDPAFGVRFGSDDGRQCHSTISTRCTIARNTKQRKVYHPE